MVKGKWKTFLSFQYAFNLEVPLLEDYRGQLRGARGNSWGCQQRRAILETKFLSFFIYKSISNCISSFSFCVPNAYVIFIHYCYLKDKKKDENE